MPKLPLACDFYGLLLPKDDPQWNYLINQFIDQESSGEKTSVDKYFHSKNLYEIT